VIEQICQNHNPLCFSRSSSTWHVTTMCSLPVYRAGTLVAPGLCQLHFDISASYEGTEGSIKCSVSNDTASLLEESRLIYITGVGRSLLDEKPVKPKMRSLTLMNPVHAVWAMTALAFLLGIPMLWSPTAFTAMGSITCLGLYASCKRQHSPFLPRSCLHDDVT